MASIAVSVSLQGACSSYHIIQKQLFQVRAQCSFRIKQSAHVVHKNVELKRVLEIIVGDNGLKDAVDESGRGTDAVSSAPRFYDARWKNGTWDLNMFVKDGRMDWDGVITAEARKRKFLELYPEAATNLDPVLFSSSIISWWAWFDFPYSGG